MPASRVMPRRQIAALATAGKNVAIAENEPYNEAEEGRGQGRCGPRRDRAQCESSAWYLAALLHAIWIGFSSGDH
jgi:hypothetical protein